MNEIEILLVEDSAADITLTLLALKKYNLANKLTCLKNGVEALDYVTRRAEESPGFSSSAVILLDLNLPLMNGIEFLHEIRANEKLKDIPVALLTSSSELPEIKESLRMGVRYISKPIAFEDLIRFTKELGFSTLIGKRQIEPNC